MIVNFNRYVLLITLFMLSSLIYAQSLTIVNAVTINDQGEPQPKTNIVIEDGLITEIGSSISGNNSNVLDAEGAYIIPGLIDAHVHVESVPGSDFRQDDDETIERLRKEQLKSFLASGVTSVLDASISSEALTELKQHLDQGGIGPNLYALGPTFVQKDGYQDADLQSKHWGHDHLTVSKPDDVERQFDGFQHENIVGVKVLIENGWGPFAVWEEYSPEVRQEIVSVSTKYKRDLHVHAITEESQETALEMNPRALAHSGFFESMPSEKFINSMKAKQVYIHSTIAGVLELQLDEYYPERLRDPLIKLAVPNELLRTVNEPDAWESMNDVYIDISSPWWLPNFFGKFVKSVFYDDKAIKGMVDNVGAALLELHNQGVPIAVGSDSGNFPFMINFFHGPSTIREIELLGEAGIPAADVLSSATIIPAKMMRQDHLIGSIDVGKKADLVILKENPAKNLSALRELSWVVKGGVAHTPKGWMEQD